MFSPLTFRFLNAPPRWIIYLHHRNLLIRAQILAFLLGFLQQNIWITLWIGLGGTALAFLMVVPPFPMYRETPEKWLPKGSGLVGGEISVG